MSNQLSEFQISLKEIHYLSPKVNQGLELIFVVEGQITVETDSHFYELNELDLLVINRNELFQIKGNPDNYVLSLTISDTFIDRFYKNYRDNRFECYSKEVHMGREKMLNNLRKWLIKLIISYYRQDESHQIEFQKYLCDILLTLIRGFKKKGSSSEKLDTNDQRLMQIINYLERNYDQPITLEEMARKSYLSTTYLSRYFKQKMNMGFSRYLMTIRLKHSVKDLLYTNDTVSQISMNNGFPNTKSFTTLFKENYGMTPHVYREKHSVEKKDSFKEYPLEDAEQPVHSPEILGKLGVILNTLDQSYKNTQSKFEELSLDITAPGNIPISRPKHMVIAHELKELQKENIRAQILMAKREIGVDFVGISNLLKGEAISAEIETDEIIPTSSQYFKTDIALEFLKQQNLALFVRIDYQELTMDEENYLRKLEHFLKHCLQLYGGSYLSAWHFLFYEPYNTIVAADELKRVYFRLYHLIKGIVPDIHVGMFLPFSFEKEKTSEAHIWLLKEAEFVDFIGYHSNQNDVVDFKELNDDRFFLTKDYLKEKTEKIKAYLKKNGIKKPLHVISWNTLSGNTRLTNGRFFRAALVLENMLDISDEVESVGFWINTVVHESESDGQRIRIEGLELFHYFDGKRPAYFALMFAKRLNGKIVAQGPDYMMTKNERGYQLVLMNSKTVNPYYLIEETFLQMFNKDLFVKIKGMEPGEYQVRKYTFDREHGALYTNWIDLNSRYGLDMEVIDYINRSSYPQLEIFDEKIMSDWSFYSYLTVNAIHFFDIRKAVL
ncbi:beta-xylosidase [Solibacillus silvestris]|nr:helix-turn-helix domain-containing protein [Solibacillus silvestris]OBW59477.1 beta-xylosidase [Solibacillus silvestris]